MGKVYMCIDLKSFYASVECRERNLDPLITNLVVADESHTDKTVCLAVTPSLKKYGLSGRSRLYEVKQKVKEINFQRKRNINNKEFKGKTYNSIELEDKYKKLDFIIAPPRMKLYMKYSTDIYNIYLKYISKEDMYVYSIDEVFFDVTTYLSYYGKTQEELATMIIHDVYDTTGITATAGIGTNLYLCKIAMDVLAKHSEPDEKGVRIACLDEKTYKEKLWDYKPITSFWRIGKGIAKTLEKNHMYTMGDIALMSLNNQELFFKLFGINAEFIIDHAWGYEPVEIKDIKKYKPKINSLCKGQVLHSPYDYKKTRLIIKEMIELLSLELVEKQVVTNQIILTIGYDVDNLRIDKIRNKYYGEITLDRYGREVPKHAHGTINLDIDTSSTNILMKNILELYDRIINKNLLIRRINITVNNIINKELIKNKEYKEQLSLFSNEEKLDNKQLESEEKLQSIMNNIKYKYGKNAILKGMNLEEGATTIERNNQVGGHKA